MVSNGWFLGIEVAIVVSVMTAIIQRIWPVSTLDAKRLARLERRVSELSARLGIEEEPLNEVQELIARGLKINAIKLYREQTGMSLAVSKDAVDAIEAQMKASDLA
ncbi:MAG: hypothetical protein ACRYFS_12645 [Janthinobacterium lividum]